MHSHSHTHNHDRDNPLNRKISIVLAGIALLLLAGLALLVINPQFTINVLAQLDSQEELAGEDYFIAEVVEVGEEPVFDEVTGLEGIPVSLQGASGSYDGRLIEVNLSTADANFTLSDNGQLNIDEGEELIVLATEVNGEQVFYVDDKYRLSPVILSMLIFFALAILFAGIKGFTALIGLIVSFTVLMVIIVPQILAGADPLLVSFLGAIIIAVFSLYLAHGFNTRTTLAVISTLFSVVLSVGLALFFVEMTRLVGVGSEEALYVQALGVADIDLRGLLLGGIIIGALGVLDDITTTQTAAVEEIFLANPKAEFSKLYSSALSVGKEHITSLVNTLVLAYAGASFPLLLLLVAESAEPLWVTLNSEFIVEEIIRSVVGSATLIFAVPISTALAAYYFTKYTGKAPK
jgi:uncharacterized membrane protein